jgi:hypothetical protein
MAGSMQCAWGLWSLGSLAGLFFFVCLVLRLTWPRFRLVDLLWFAFLGLAAVLAFHVSLCLVGAPLSWGSASSGWLACFVMLGAFVPTSALQGSDGRRGLGQSGGRGAQRGLAG